MKLEIEDEIESLQTKLPYIVRGFGNNLDKLCRDYNLYNKGNLIIGHSVDEDKSEPLIYITIGNCYFNEIDTHIIDTIKYIKDNFKLTGKTLKDYKY